MKPLVSLKSIKNIIKTLYYVLSSFVLNNAKYELSVAHTYVL
jgi:hypothetical protein